MSSHLHHPLSHIYINNCAFNIIHDHCKLFSQSAVQCHLTRTASELHLSTIVQCTSFMIIVNCFPNRPFNVISPAPPSELYLSTIVHHTSSMIIVNCFPKQLFNVISLAPPSEPYIYINKCALHIIHDNCKLPNHPFHLGSPAPRSEPITDYFYNFLAQF